MVDPGADTSRDVAAPQSTLPQSLYIPEDDYVFRKKLECCCGRENCAFLTHNNAALDDLEKDVHTAAQLGQALLVRHEQYMADAERERLDLTAKIEALENDKKDLEMENRKTVEENRGLLDHLEGLNDSISESEARVGALEATLQSTQQELRRLEILASRTSDLETQLAALEQEQANLQSTIVTSAAEERSAIQRWRKAERGLNDLQEQLERIEREAREERERHVEVIGRMERQRAVEKELDGASGRLKGAAAVSRLGQGKSGGSSVVSHFVKDILQDNANLQMGIVELRELLMNSNDEVQSLREQLMLHQPIGGELEDDGPPTLRAELAPIEPQMVSQELHIHHHYHTPQKKEEVRRPKKRRHAISPGLFTPPNGSPSSRMPRPHRLRPTPQSLATAILSQTSTTIPVEGNFASANTRWSVQSGATTASEMLSSVPSSPQSIHRNSAVFDRPFNMYGGGGGGGGGSGGDTVFDSSRPTSPGSSVDPMSPVFKPYHRKRGSDQSMRSFVNPSPFHPSNTIHEEEDDTDDNADVHVLKQLDDVDDVDDMDDDVDDMLARPADKDVITGMIGAPPQQGVSAGQSSSSLTLDSADDGDLSAPNEEPEEDDSADDIDIYSSAPAFDPYDPSHFHHHHHNNNNTANDSNNHEYTQPHQPHRPLRHTASHESILSIAGQDIHTLQSRPSQLTLTGCSNTTTINPHQPSSSSSSSSAFYLRRAPPSLFHPASSSSSSSPSSAAAHGRSPPTAPAMPSLSGLAATATTAPVLGLVVAQPVLARGGPRGHDSSSHLRSNFVAQAARQGAPHGYGGGGAGAGGGGGGLGRIVGGWVWSKWGVAPQPASEPQHGVPGARSSSSAAADNGSSMSPRRTTPGGGGGAKQQQLLQPGAATTAAAAAAARRAVSTPMLSTTSSTLTTTTTAAAPTAAAGAAEKEEKKTSAPPPRINVVAAAGPQTTPKPASLSLSSASSSLPSSASMAPSISSSSSSSSSASAASAAGADPDAEAAALLQLRAAMGGRAPGVNQRGPVPGLWRASGGAGTALRAKDVSLLPPPPPEQGSVDVEALKEGLEG